MRIKLIYILGVSYSGSTLLSFLMGSHPKVHNLGEIKGLYSIGNYSDKTCLCGKRLSNCDFWNKFEAIPFEIVDKRSLPRISYEYLQILFGKKIKENSHIDAPDFKFLNVIANSFDREIPRKKLLVDSSKSLWRLIHLLECDGIDVKVIYLKRAISPNISSFIKHKKGFLAGLLVYKLQHHLINKFFKNNPQVPHLDISYEALCNNVNAQMERIGKFLELNLENFQSDLSNKEFHVVMGNTGSIKQIIQGELNIKLDESWKTRLTPLQKKILTWFE